MKLNKLSIILAVILITILSFIAYQIIRVDNDNYMPSYRPIDRTDTFNLRLHINSIPADRVLNYFPYKMYLNYANFNNVQIIKRDINILNSKFPTTLMDNQAVLSMALTDSLKVRIFKKYELYDSEALIYLLQWAERFKFYGEVDIENELLFNSIYDYWKSFICNKLSTYSSQNSKIKFDFKFRYLTAKCSQLKGSVSPKITPTEKVIYNILDNKWSHLLNASFYQSSFLQKLLISIIIIFTTFSWFITIFLFINKIKKK